MKDNLGLGIFIGILLVFTFFFFGFQIEDEFVYVSGKKGDVKTVNYKGVVYKLNVLTQSGGGDK